MKLIRKVSELVVGDSFKDISDSDSARYALVIGFRSGTNPVSKRRTRIIEMECLSHKNVPYKTEMSLLPTAKVWMKKR